MESEGTVRERERERERERVGVGEGKGGVVTEYKEKGSTGLTKMSVHVSFLSSVRACVCACVCVCVCRFVNLVPWFTGHYNVEIPGHKEVITCL